MVVPLSLSSVSYGNESNEVLKEAKGYYFLAHIDDDTKYSYRFLVRLMEI